MRLQLKLGSTVDEAAIPVVGGDAGGMDPPRRPVHACGEIHSGSDPSPPRQQHLRTRADPGAITVSPDRRPLYAARGLRVVRAPAVNWRKRKGEEGAMTWEVPESVRDWLVKTLGSAVHIGIPGMSSTLVSVTVGRNVMSPMWDSLLPGMQRGYCPPLEGVQLWSRLTYCTFSSLLSREGMPTPLALWTPAFCPGSCPRIVPLTKRHWALAMRAVASKRRSTIHLSALPSFMNANHAMLDLVPRVSPDAPPSP
ncbi:hypothetical protein BDZ91DRAFT_766608 [Kalaharituber pfeilii]|nr:hypothetical protein BDZ91DRAFT_766608 [Kalaharituber pfeilii]